MEILESEEGTKTGRRTGGKVRKRHPEETFRRRSRPRSCKRIQPSPCDENGSVYRRYFSSTRVDVRALSFPSRRAGSRGSSFFLLLPERDASEQRDRTSNNICLVDYDVARFFLSFFPSPGLSFPPTLPPPLSTSLTVHCFSRGEDALSHETAICQRTRRTTGSGSPKMYVRPTTTTKTTTQRCVFTKGSHSALEQRVKRNNTNYFSLIARPFEIST